MATPPGTSGSSGGKAPQPAPAAAVVAPPPHPDSSQVSDKVKKAASISQVSDMVKKAASISSLAKQVASISSPNKQALPSSQAIQQAAQGQTAAATESPIGTGGVDEPTRKRARVDDDVTKKDTTDSSSQEANEKLNPFTSLPFYGDHKRAISSFSFAPTTSSARINGGMSLNNSNAGSGIISSVLCASASSDGSAKVWDVTKNLFADGVGSQIITPGKQRRGGAGSSGTTPPATFSTGSAISTRLDPKLTLFGHSRGINDVTWSPTAAYVATASDDKTLRLWSAETGDAFVEFRGHTNFVFSCRFNPQSNLLVSGVSLVCSSWM